MLSSQLFFGRRCILESASYSSLWWSRILSQILMAWLGKIMFNGCCWIFSCMNSFVFRSILRIPVINLALLLCTLCSKVICGAFKQSVGTGGYVNLDRIKTFIYLYLLYCHLLPPRGVGMHHAKKRAIVTEKQSLRKRRKSENFPFIPFWVVGLATKGLSPFKGFI